MSPEDSKTSERQTERRRINGDVLRAGRTHSEEMSICPKATHRFNATPSKTPMALSTELEQVIINLVRKHKKLQIGKQSLRKKNKAGDTIPSFTLHCRATEVKAVWDQHTRDGASGEAQRGQRPVLTQSSASAKGGRSAQRRKMASSIHGVGEPGQHVQKNQTGLLSHIMCRHKLRGGKTSM